MTPVHNTVIVRDLRIDAGRLIPLDSLADMVSIGIAHRVQRGGCVGVIVLRVR